MKRGAHWSFVKVDHTRKIIFIQDNNGPVSVTNMAESVTDEAVCLEADGIDTSNYRLFYKDSSGTWDELVHKNGRFLAFAFGRGVHP